jgi:D-alanine-D-alanine ligase-like ATP-grasp enzyme
VKVKKRIFKREFLEYRLVVVVFDIYEMSQEDENTVLDINKVFYVFPLLKGVNIEDEQIEKMLEMQPKI